MFGLSTLLAVSLILSQPEPTIEEQIADQMGPEMVEILRCESNLKHFDENGEVLLSPTQDLGISQLNLPSHLEESQKLGIDIYTLEGNLEYATLLYKQRGTEPWVCSKMI